MPKPVLLLAALLAAPAFAQTGAAPPAGGAPAGEPGAPPPAFMTAAQAFGRCIGTKSLASPATTAPEAAAHAAILGCQTEKTVVDAQFEGWVAGPTFPAEGRDTARAQYKQQMAGLEVEVVNGLRQKRAETAAPAPSAPPTPRR